MPETQEGRGQSLSLRDFLSVLFRRKWIVLVVLLATVAVTVRLALSTETVYESYSKMLVSRGEQTTAFSANYRLLSWEEELSSELEAIRSARVYQRAQELLDERGAVDEEGEPLVINPDRIDAGTPGKSHVVTISYRSGDPVGVVAVVQALTEAYREFRTSTRGQDPTTYLQQEIDDVAHEIEHWEQERAAFLVREGAVELPQERIQLLTTKRNLETELASVRADVAEGEARVRWLRHLLSDAQPEEASTRSYAFSEPNMRGESLLMTLRRLYQNSQAEYFDLRAEYTDNHPRVLALQDRLRELRASLRTEAEAYLGYMNAQLQATWARVSSLQASIDYIDERLGRFPDREAQLAHLDRTIESLRSTHTALVRSRVDALRTRLGSNLWDVVVLQEAVEPYPASTIDHVRLAIIPLFALLVAIGLAFLFDGLDHSFKELREVEAYLKAPMLGEIRHFKR